MLLAFIAEISAMIVTLCLVLPKVEFSSPYCVIRDTPDLFMAYWRVSQLIYLICITTLTSLTPQAVVIGLRIVLICTYPCRIHWQHFERLGPTVCSIHLCARRDMGIRHHIRCVE